MLSPDPTAVESNPYKAPVSGELNVPNVQVPHGRLSLVFSMWCLLSAVALQVVSTTAVVVWFRKVVPIPLPGIAHIVLTTIVSLALTGFLLRRHRPLLAMLLAQMVNLTQWGAFFSLCLRCGALAGRV